MLIECDQKKRNESKKILKSIHSFSSILAVKQLRREGARRV
jgi:hypothetical protein